MNAAAAEALFEAERKGVRQVVGRNSDGEGGRCAVGVLYETWAWQQGFIPLLHENGNFVTSYKTGCRFSLDYGLTEPEGREIVRLNNEERRTFAEIARKLGPDSV